MKVAKFAFGFQSEPALVGEFGFLYISVPNEKDNG